jgi:hypothetical protein
VVALISSDSNSFQALGKDMSGCLVVDVSRENGTNKSCSLDEQLTNSIGETRSSLNGLEKFLKSILTVKVVLLKLLCQKIKNFVLFGCRASLCARK